MKTKLHKGLTMLLVATVLLMAAACKSGRQTSGTQHESPAGREYIRNVIDGEMQFDVLSCKMRMTAAAGTQSLSTSCSLKIQKDKLITISAQLPIIGTEVGRAEIAPDGILLVDKWHKKYLQLTIGEIQALTGTDFDFYTVQALLTNSLFIPGKKDVSKNDTRHFLTSRNEDGEMEITLKDKPYILTFLAGEQDKLIRETRVSSGTNKSMTWKYSSFKDIDGKKFPSGMKVQLTNSPSKYTISIDLSKITTGGKTMERFKLTDKYEKADINDLHKLINSF